MVREQNRPNLNKMLGSIGEGQEEVEQKKVKEIKRKRKEEIKEEVVVEKSKRSYMLTEKQIEILMTMRAKHFRKNDLSEIVGMAIEFLYKETSKNENRFKG